MNLLAKLSFRKDRAPTNGRPEQATTRNGHTTLKNRAPKKQQPSESFEMVKRRATVNLAILERPLMTSTEFVVDARYRNMKLLDSGSYGIVVRAFDSKTNTAVAIKKIFSAFSSSRMARHVLREVRLLRHLEHPHIVKLLDIDVPGQYTAWDSVYIVTPLLQVDLYTAFRQGKVDDVQTQKKIAYQLLLALEHMHSHGLMHRDIKSKNLLLDKDMNVQLCDLGESRFYSKANRDILFEDEPGDELEPQLSGVITTILQSAPELVFGDEYDAEVDIWAAGCVIAEIVRPGHGYLFDSVAKQSHFQEIIDVVGYPPPDVSKAIEKNASWVLRRVRKSTGNRIAEMLGPSVDPLAIDLVEKMLTFSRKQRISATEALHHPWFHEFKDETINNRGKYDFAHSEPSKKTSKAKLKRLVWDEIIDFHPEAAGMSVR